MEINKEQPQKISWWKKYNFIIICFLSSLPLLALGIWGILINYRPYSTWQTSNMYWARWVGIILFILIVEFVVVCLPVIMIHIKDKENDKNNKNDDYKFRKNNLKKQLHSSLITYHIALQKLKKDHNKIAIEQIKKDISKAKLVFRTKLSELNKIKK
ncbi:MAG: hypothetical protein LBF36_03650 [Mycoplasmataceae bacterium]|nr:hypothetical protein [Mycoplasmataceae bacterium]